MRLLLQRALKGQVTCYDGDAITHTASIGQGLVVLVGFGQSDTLDMVHTAPWKGMIEKMLALRIFPDDKGKMNLSLTDILPTQDTNGLLLVSQFTLHADCRKGRRPSFQQAAAPDVAKQLFDALISDLQQLIGTRLQNGIFGASMHVDFVNWGPVTIMLDSEDLYSST